MSIGNLIEYGRRRPKEVTGRMVFICFVTFFAVVFGVNAIMVRVAVSTFGGVETASSYQAGLAFAREVALVDTQDALNWHVKAKVVPANDGAMLVEVIATSSDERPLSDLQASAWLVHPTDKRADQAVILRESAPGQFRGTAMSASGQWDLVTELTRDNIRMFRSKNRIFFR
jgi:nitrogen fixation protein FixH